jgi:predicted amidophosphoribosyltransferase
MNYCPCCSGLLLAHIRPSGLAWFCPHCWQDMPVFNVEDCSSLEKAFAADSLVQKTKYRDRLRIYGISSLPSCDKQHPS